MANQVKTGLALALTAFAWSCDGTNVNETTAQRGTGGTDPAQLDIVPDDAIVSAATELVARIDGPHGGKVEWIQNEGSKEIMVAIDAVHPHPPLIAPDFVDAHGALLSWLVLSPEGARAPDRLVAAAAEKEREQASDGALLSELRKVHLSQRKEIALSVEEPESGISYAVAGCTTSFKNWVRSSYGDGYGGTATCGNAATEWPGFRSEDYFYCNLDGQDCHHSLGALDAGQCSPALQDCHAVRGRQFAAVARVTETNGNASFGWSGHRYRYGVANCSGNGALRMHRQAAGGTEKVVDVPVGHMLIFAGGTSHLHARAQAADLVTFGLWDRDIDENSSGYKGYSFWLSNNAAANDRAIFCTDLQTEIQMADISSCWGSDLCPAGHSCTGSCYD